MIKPKPAVSKPVAAGRKSSAQVAVHRNTLLSEAVLEEARRNWLLNGEKSEHVSFRAPPALLAAAKRETGIGSTNEIAVLALAMLAQPDPVVAILRKTRGRLGKDHKLET